MSEEEVDIVTRQHETEVPYTAPVRQGAETESDPEFVDSFIDSRGILRSTERPVVMLDKEARDAIDGFFTEHYHLADTIETTVELTRRLIEVSGSEDSQLQFFETIRSADALRRHHEEEAYRQQSTHEAEATDHTDRFPAGAEVATLAHEVSAAREQLDALPFGLHSTDYGSIQEILAKLPDKVLEELEGVKTSGIKLRASKQARQELVDSINYALNTVRDRLTREAGRDTDMSRKIREQCAQILLARLRQFPADPVEELEDRAQHERRLQRGMDIVPGNTPAQNETVLTELNPEIEDILEAYDDMESIQDEILGYLTSPDVHAAIELLDQKQQQELFDGISADLSGILSRRSASSDGVRNQVARLGNAASLSRRILPAAVNRVHAAMDFVFRERALPMLYVSDSERTRAQELIDSVNALDTKRKLPERHIDRMFSLRGLDIVSAAQVLTHATGFSEEIVASGAIMPKQEQIDRTGTLHEQMRAAYTSSDGTLSTHSSVPHFAKGWSLGYAPQRENGVRGVFLVPMGSIVAHAPYDSEGRRLKTLPAVPTSGELRGGMHVSKTNDRHDDDYVFYASPDVAHSDDYVFPVEEACAVLIQPDSDTIVSVPEHLAERIIVVEHQPRSSEDVAISRAASELQALLDRQYAGQLVVPLREGGLTFQPEVPRVVISRPTRFSSAGGYGRRGISAPKRRVHSSERV